MNRPPSDGLPDRIHTRELRSSRWTRITTHPANDLVQKEEVELGEHEENEGQSKVPNRAELPQDAEDDVCHEGKIQDCRDRRPDAREHEEADVVQRLGRRRLEHAREAERGVKGDVKRAAEDDKREDGERDECRGCSILDDLCRDHAVGKQHPEEGHNESGMDRCKDSNRCCSLNETRISFV
jgi:hypothetical protein